MALDTAAGFPLAESDDYGRRLLNSVIDARAAAGHERPYACLPRSSTLQGGFREISYGVLANAINRCAHWLRLNISPGNGETIAYIAPPDLRHQILALAAVKSGHVMFFPSPRNAPNVLEKLFEDARASVYLYASAPSEAMQAVLHRRFMKSLAMPSLAEILDETPVENIAFAGEFDDYRFFPFVKLHTSGSTGMPKIVPVKHGLVSAIDAYHLLEHNEIARRYGNMRIFTPFPPFHIAGLLYSLTIMIWIDSTVVLPPAGVPVTAELIHKVNSLGGVEHCQLAPSLVTELTQKPEWLAGLGKLDGLTFSGGPLSEETAEIVSKQTTLSSSLGATEYGAIPMLPKSPEDWKYFRFNEVASGLDFQETDQPGLYELVFVRSPASITNLIQSIFVTYPDLDEYRTKDCFSKHPTKPGLWKYELRLDDILVLSNGENVATVPMENTIGACPAVKGCVVVGQGRFQTALLVERRDPTMSDFDTSEALQPFLDRANESCPTYAHIAYDKLIFTKPDKPLPRAAKGTVQRGRASQAYREEIAECYARPSKLVRPSSLIMPKVGTLAETQASLLLYLRQMRIFNVHGELGPTDDFFALGMDSLQVISLVQAINLVRPRSQPPVTPAFVYNHSTAARLAAALASGKKIKDYSDFDDDDEDTKETWLAMEQVFQDTRIKDATAAGGHQFSMSRVLRSDKPAPIYQPDGGLLAWRQVVGSFLINMSNWGLVNSFGVFQTYYAATFLTNYSASDIAWIGTVQGTLLLVVGVISGPLFDKGYFRTIQLVSGVGLVFGLMMLSLATQYYQIMLTQGILVGLCAGLLYIPSVALIPLYFKRYRGLALGIATAGGSFGGILYPIIFRRLLDQVGFAWATRVIGFVTLISLGSAALLMKPIGPRSTRKLFDLRALSDGPYIAFTATSFFSFAGLLVPYFLTTDYAESAISMPEDLSFYLLAVLNAAQFFGRVLPALLSDWIGPELLLLAANALVGVLGFCWIAATSSAGFIVWVIFYGFISGMVVSLPPAVLPYICPTLAVIGTRLGMLYAAAGLGFLISSPVALVLVRDASGYLGAQCWVGACCLVAAAFFTITAVEARKRRLLYEVNGPGSRKMYLFRKEKNEGSSFDSS